MAGYKVGRLAQDIKYELSILIRELKDPRISEIISIVKVSLSNDLSHCKVYVSAIEGFEQTQESVKGLKSATGYLKRELSNRLRMRKCPDLVFVADDSIAYGAQITKIMEDLRPEDQEDEKDKTDA